MNNNENTQHISQLTIGKSIPDFTAEVYNPATFQFDEFRFDEILKNKKWLVIMFYPGDYTFVCPTELADLAEKYEEFQSLNIEILSISTDTKYVHAAWQKAETILSDIKFMMGSDANAQISKLFGVYNEDTGLAERGTFIINPDGMLVASEINFQNVGRNSNELFRKVKAFIHVRANPEEVCPAKWEKGDATLKPGVEIVGKIKETLK
jgi:peroxiredoxin